MSKTTVIDVARDFSSQPGARHVSDGPHSGQEFRVHHLEPALEGGNYVWVDLDGGVGFAECWLDEAFGGLVRKYGRSVVKRIEIESPLKPWRARSAWKHVRRALQEVKGKS